MLGFMAEQPLDLAICLLLAGEYLYGEKLLSTSTGIVRSMLRLLHWTLHMASTLIFTGCDSNMGCRMQKHAGQSYLEGSSCDPLRRA